MKCLLWMLEAIGLTIGAAAVLVALRYVLWPLWWLIGKYWDWVSDTFSPHSDFYELLFAATPIVALVFSLIALLVCLGGK